MVAPHLYRETATSQYDNHTVKSLKEFARARAIVYGLRGYSKLRKADLIDRLRKHDRELNIPKTAAEIAELKRLREMAEKLEIARRKAVLRHNKWIENTPGAREKQNDANRHSRRRKTETGKATK